MFETFWKSVSIKWLNDHFPHPYREGTPLSPLWKYLHRLWLNFRCFLSSPVSLLPRRVVPSRNECGLRSLAAIGDGAYPVPDHSSPSVFAKFFSFLSTEPFVKLSFILSLKEIWQNHYFMKKKKKTNTERQFRWETVLSIMFYYISNRFILHIIEFLRRK